MSTKKPNTEDDKSYFIWDSIKKVEPLSNFRFLNLSNYFELIVFSSIFTKKKKKNFLLSKLTSSYPLQKIFLSKIDYVCDFATNRRKEKKLETF